MPRVARARELVALLLLSISVARSDVSHHGPHHGLVKAILRGRASSELAIPTDAYENAYADMRPSLPSSSFSPDGSPIKLLLPSFSLKQTQAAHTTQLSDARSLALAQRAVLLGRVELSGDALASVDPANAKHLAAARLAAKHEDGMKKEGESSNLGPTEHGAAARVVYSSPHLSLADQKMKSSSSWLAQAVMVLAILAGGAIIGGIGAVAYCWKTRDMTGADEDAKEKARSGNQGKNFGRPTAQYGSYGAKRGR
mmetsp:Transcript_35028/g.83041  ORF Transcript_35028/g.83041 Transcript_35028/m.83041 type:complete len:255 (-) Transcript_35028:34-798(-)